MDETKFDTSKEINLNCVLHCPCRENRFTQANIGISASEIPKHSLSGLLCFQTNCQKCCCIDRLSFNMCHTLKTRCNT